ncbi:MAG: aggregation factor core [Pseudomonadota bacterium]
MIKTFALTLLALTPGAAEADLLVSFRDSAPRDIFILQNDGSCPINGAVELDLEPSPSGLFFDVTAEGAGVEVFQPLRVEAGAGYLSAVPVVRDGDKSVVLSVAGLPPGEQVRFTADLDDSLTNGTFGQIRVSGSEIAGAIARVAGGAQAPFDGTGRAVMPVACAGA